MNDVRLSGRVASNPITRYSKNGDLITDFSLCVVKKFKKKDTDGHYPVEFYTINNYNELAEICRDFIKKGTIVVIQGHLKKSKAEKTGQSYINIVSDKLEFYNTIEDVPISDCNPEIGDVVLE